LFAAVKPAAAAKASWTTEQNTRRDATTSRFAGYGRVRNVTRRRSMTDHTYRVIELAGSSETSHADAIQNAIARASKTMRNLRWFEVTQQRGEIENGKIQHYQVTMKVGFTLED
jgi:flavin-binding protein dodecin